MWLQTSGRYWILCLCCLMQTSIWLFGCFYLKVSFVFYICLHPYLILVLKLEYICIVIFLLQLSVDKTERKTCTKGNCSYNCIQSCIIHWTYLLFLRIISHYCGIWVSWLLTFCWHHYKSNAGNLISWLLIMYAHSQILVHLPFSHFPFLPLLCFQVIYVNRFLPSSRKQAIREIKVKHFYFQAYCYLIYIWRLLLFDYWYAVIWCSITFLFSFIIFDTLAL